MYSRLLEPSQQSSEVFSFSFMRASYFRSQDRFFIFHILFSLRLFSTHLTKPQQTAGIVCYPVSVARPILWTTLLHKIDRIMDRSASVNEAFVDVFTMDLLQSARYANATQMRFLLEILNFHLWVSGMEEDACPDRCRVPDKIYFQVLQLV